MQSVPFATALRAALLLAAAACSRVPAPPTKPAVDSTAYATETREWRIKRLDAIAGADGWSTVAGLFWLDGATHSIGSAASNSIVMPPDHTPRVFGTITRTDTTFQFAAARGVEVYSDSVRVDTISIVHDKGRVPTVLRSGSVTYRVIERGGRFALRVKDSALVLRTDFKGLEYFPLDTSMRVLAKLVPHPAPRSLRILNVIGQTEEYRSPGALEFTIAGQPYRITAAFEGADTTQYFLIFRDASSRDLTYPAGRFMYTTLADSAGHTVLDFNRAFNPPCAFTPFATCPLPPAENVLSVAIRAGEKRYAGPHGSTAVEIGGR